MGGDIPARTLDSSAAAWLATMQTVGDVPEYMHWNRGLAALALGDLSTARTIAALPGTGRINSASLRFISKLKEEAYGQYTKLFK